MIKKRVLLISFLLFNYLTVSYGQTSFGLKAGGSLVSLEDNILGYSQESENMLRYYTGVLGEKNINQKFILRGELLYSAKGRGGIKNQNGYAPVKLNYLALPILIGYKISPKFSVYLGPEFDYLLAGYLYAVNNGPDRNKIDFKAGDSRKNFDYGLDTGLSFKVADFLNVEARYCYGLKEVINGLGNDRGESNQVLQLGFNYFMNLRKK